MSQQYIFKHFKEERERIRRECGIEPDTEYRPYETETRPAPGAPIGPAPAWLR